MSVKRVAVWVAVGLLLLPAAPAHAFWRVNIGIGFPVYRPYYPVYVAPAPVYVVQPAPVYVQGAPGYVQSAPGYPPPLAQPTYPAPTAQPAPAAQPAPTTGAPTLPPQPIPVVPAR
jgi:hypothetical protein